MSVSLNNDTFKRKFLLRGRSLPVAICNVTINPRGYIMLIGALTLRRT